MKRLCKAIRGPWRLSTHLLVGIWASCGAIILAAAYMVYVKGPADARDLRNYIIERRQAPKVGTSGEDRTPDLLVRSQAL